MSAGFPPLEVPLQDAGCLPFTPLLKGGSQGATSSIVKGRTPETKAKETRENNCFMIVPPSNMKSEAVIVGPVLSLLNNDVGNYPEIAYVHTRTAVHT